MIVSVGLVAAACSSSSDPAELSGAVDSTAPTAAPALDVAESTTTTVSPTTTLDVVTTIRRVPASELTSEGFITVGEDQYNFSFECYAAGAGDILALGVGVDPETSETTQAIVQAFLGQPYVAVFVGDRAIRELAIDQPAELFVQGDNIVGSALRFVDVVETAGVGEELGLGSVSVGCASFAPGLPEGYELS